MSAISNYAKAAKNGNSQRERSIGRTDEVKNNAGGYVFKTADTGRLERFLILGTDGGTYYATERDLTKENIDFVVEMIKSSERAVVETLVSVAENNRAAKNSPSLFVLALVYAHGTDKEYLREAGVFNKIVRTGTHLFEITGYMKALGGMGRAKRNALANWYTDKEDGSIAYQAVKYRQRAGFTHRDVFRISHPKGVNPSIGDFILGNSTPRVKGAVKILDGFEQMQKAESVEDVIATLTEYKSLPWETIPTQFLREIHVWKTLFYNGALGLTALVRNITRLHEIGAFKDVRFAGDVAKAIANEENIRKSRIHPVALANARGMYSKGKHKRVVYYWGEAYSWTPWETPANAKVLGALEKAFYMAFGNVEPSNARTLVALDVSPSMWSAAPAGLVGLNAAEAAGLMAMVAIRTEPYVEVVGFNNRLVSINLTDADSFEAVMSKMRSASRAWGGTDVAVPMVNALNDKQEFDAFIIYTDNDTHSGRVKPNVALKNYQSGVNPRAKVAVVAMTSSEFTVADPKMFDSMRDFVGFDASAPAVIADFFRQ